MAIHVDRGRQRERVSRGWGGGGGEGGVERSGSDKMVTNGLHLSLGALSICIVDNPGDNPEIYYKVGFYCIARAKLDKNETLKVHFVLVFILCHIRLIVTSAFEGHQTSVPAS